MIFSCGLHVDGHHQTNLATTTVATISPRLLTLTERTHRVEAVVIVPNHMSSAMDACSLCTNNFFFRFFRARTIVAPLAPPESLTHCHAFENTPTQAVAYKQTPPPPPAPPPSFNDCVFTPGQDFHSKTSNDTGHPVPANSKEVGARGRCSSV